MNNNISPNSLDSFMLPEYLYHGTFSVYLKSIKKEGIRGNKTNWTDSKTNLVYLATDPEIAYDFVSNSENEDIPEEYFDDIVVFKIKTNKLDMNKINVDSNIIFNEDEEIYSYEYAGIVPVSAIVGIKHYKD